MIKKIIVLSKSPIKYQAVTRWLNVLGCDSIEIECIDSEPTGCGHPFGKQSATECLLNRLPEILSKDTLYIGIENFIEMDATRWYDKVAVAIYVVHDNSFLYNIAVGQFNNIIPKQFIPKTNPDIIIPFGYSKTVGNCIHEAYPAIPHDNWATSVSPINVDRVTQIFDALRCFQIKTVVSLANDCMVI